MDVTERLRERPAQEDVQERMYSGKKKTHTEKNLVITAPNKRIVYLGASTDGSVHDKKMADSCAFVFSAMIILLADSGFQGLNLGAATLLLPCKKPRKKERPAHQRLWNTYLSRVRVSVENAFANVKTFRIVKEIIRLKKPATRDMVMEIACGLANLRLSSP
jgi:hypothetical protein